MTIPKRVDSMNCDDHWESQVAVGRGIAARELVWPQFDMAMEHGPFVDELHICKFNFTKGNSSKFSLLLLH